MASDTPLSRLLAHCMSVRTNAFAAGVNSIDCLTLNRFLGKAMLLLEAMFESENGAAPSEDVIGKFKTTSFMIKPSRREVVRFRPLNHLSHAILLPPFPLTHPLYPDRR